MLINFPNLGQLIAASEHAKPRHCGIRILTAAGP